MRRHSRTRSVLLISSARSSGGTISNRTRPIWEPRSPRPPEPAVDNTPSMTLSPVSGSICLFFSCSAASAMRLIWPWVISNGVPCGITSRACAVSLWILGKNIKRICPALTKLNTTIMTAIKNASVVYRKRKANASTGWYICSINHSSPSAIPC